MNKINLGCYGDWPANEYDSYYAYCRVMSYCIEHTYWDYCDMDYLLLTINLKPWEKT
jgi:hypothetical protein